MAMEMYMGVSQKLSQRMQMSPQLYQVIEILQIPVLDLRRRLEAEADQNPFLDPEESTTESPNQLESPVPVEGTKEHEDALRAEKNQEREEILEALRDEYEAFSSFSNPTFSGDVDPKLQAMMNTSAPGCSLSDHLMPQIHIMDLSDELASTVEILASILDKRGYFSKDYREELADIISQNAEVNKDEDIVFNPSQEIIDQAVEIVRSLDPSGVGAFDIVDCLLIQLNAKDGDLDVEKQVVKNHLMDLAKNKLPEIASSLGVSIERILAAREVIKKLNPTPGNEFAHDSTQYIVADVIIKDRDGNLEVMLNQGLMPKFRFNARLFERMKKELLKKADKKFATDKKEAAKSLLNALDQRNRIIFRIAEAIVEHQRDYFKKGRKHLKSFLMKDLADELDIDVSTVSRAVSGKYMDCPQGIVALREMFTAGYKKTDGDDISDEAIKEKLKQIVAGEEKVKPYSDQKITDLLKKDGIEISRRTVTKYREELEIPNSRKRKKY